MPKDKQETVTKKRKRGLEDDYDQYSRSLRPHTLNGSISKRDAEILHDRALTLIDIASIYWNTKQYSRAKTCINSAIKDLLEAIDIFEQLSDANIKESIKSYNKLLKVFQANQAKVSNKLVEQPQAAPGTPIADMYSVQIQDTTPHTPPRINNASTYKKSISPGSHRHTRNSCKLFNCDSGSESDSSNTSLDDKRRFRGENNISARSIFKL